MRCKLPTLVANRPLGSRATPCENKKPAAEPGCGVVKPYAYGTKGRAYLISTPRMFLRLTMP
jgi:hypothetical protein